MKKRLFNLVFIFIIICSITACNDKGSKDNSNKKKSKESKTSSDFKVTQLDKDKASEISFKDANILDFKLTERDDKSYDDIIATYTVTNTSKKAVDYISANFSYTDKEDNQICDDGRFLDCQINSKKTAIITSYSNLEEKKKSTIKNITVTSYTYYMGDMAYDIDLENKTIDYYDISPDEDNNINFEDVNIIDFETVNNSKNKSSYSVELHIKNNSKQKLKYVSYDMAYYDKDMNFLDNDGRYCDSTIKPGKFATSTSYFSEDSLLKAVSSYGVYKYEYQLTEKDSNGYNYYEINLQTKEVEGSYLE